MALTQGHKLDAKTLALWRLDEATAGATLADQTGKYPLSIVVGTPVVVPGLIGDGGNARTFVADRYTAVADAALGTALTGEWTLEAWVRPDASAAGYYITINGTVRYMEIDVAEASSKKFEAYWLNGVTFQGALGTQVLTFGTRYHLAARKVAMGGGTYRMDLFINGVLDATSVAQPNTTATGTPTIFLGSDGANHFNGALDDVRLSSVARTDAEIADSYWRGLIDISPGPTVAPFRQTRTPYQDYHRALSPTALLQPNGVAFEAAQGSLKDAVLDRCLQVVKAKYPSVAPGDALASIGADRGMPRGGSESDAMYAARLLNAWNVWPWAGTPYGLLQAFYATGYKNVVLAQVRGGKQFTLDTGATNTFLWSVDIGNAAWIKRGTCVVTKNAAVAPDGTTTAAQVTGLGAAGVNDFYQTVGGGPANGTPYNPSFWIQRVSGTGTVTVGNPNGPGGAMAINLATIGTGWVRIDPGNPVAGVTVSPAFTVQSSVSGIQVYASAGAPLSFNIWMPQNELGASIAGAVTPTYSATKSTALAAGSLLTSTMGSGLWETDPLSSYSPANQSFWSKFDVLFPLPLMPPSWGWSGGIPSSSSNESNFIRALIQAWKPAHATCDRIVIVQQGNVWGYPASQLWGASTGLWGGSANTVWTP